jgi:hypothetical protein
MAQHQTSGTSTGMVASLRRAGASSSLVRFGVLTLMLLGTLFWARQKLLSPTPRTAFADPAPLLAQDGAGEVGR